MKIPKTANSRRRAMCGATLAVWCVLGVRLVSAQTTPMNQPLAEGGPNAITCELKDPPRKADIPVFDAADAKAAPGVYHYQLYLPEGYHADPARAWPCLFIASPGGNADRGPLAARLKGYVVVALVESKNGPWAPIVGNFLAAHDDVVKRVRIQEGLKMATGFSGGARASSVFVQIRPGFSGLIMQGAGAAFDAGNRYHATGLKRNSSLYGVLIMGDSDGNASEIERMKAAWSGDRLKILKFSGGHSGASADSFAEALDWIERQIYIDGPTNPALKDVYVRQFREQLAQHDAATTNWKRYEAAAALLALAQKRNLAADSSLAPALGQLRTETMRLSTDSVVARERLAADAFARLEAGRDRATPTAFATQCADLAKRYPGTEAAAKAAALAAP